MSQKSSQILSIALSGFGHAEDQDRRFDNLIPEISEGGVRIRQCQRIGSAPFLEFSVGDEVTGTITFDDGETMGISGVIYRRDKQDYIIAPLEGISFKRIVLEQRRDLNRFPSLRSK